MLPRKTWKKSSSTYVFIFNVGRGLSVFIRNPLNNGMLYDLGNSNDFSPIDWLKKNLFLHIDEYKDKGIIAQLIMSHPHADHISEISKVNELIGDNSLVTCPHDKDPDNSSPQNEKISWDRIKNPGLRGKLLEGEYKKLIKNKKLPLQTIHYDQGETIKDCEYGIYYTRPPEMEKIEESSDQEYANGISIVMHYKQGATNILIPGDINPKSFEKVLDGDPDTERRLTDFSKSNSQLDYYDKTGDQPNLGEKLRENGLSFFITPHHGLESGFCDSVYNYINGGKADIHLISEKRHTGENDGTIHSNYSSENYTKGMSVHDLDNRTDETFRRLSTANNKHLLLIFDGVSMPTILKASDPDSFLDVIFN